ncbi:MAG: extensin family protein [Hyphomicrobiaceae bacterium]
MEPRKGHKPVIARAVLLAAMAMAASGEGRATGPANPARPTPQWPLLVTDVKAPLAPVAAWTPAEIAAAKVACQSGLKGRDIVAVELPPLREGQCGSPAPLQLISVGKDPQITFSEPVVVTCEMAVAFDDWVRGDLQKTARQTLGSPIVRIEVMSSYSCRNAYGRKKTRLSEHGRANAIDIRSFVTQGGDTVSVLDGWGATARDIKARIAAAAKAAAKAAKAAQAAERAAEAKAEEIKRQAEKAERDLRKAGRITDFAAAARSGLRGGQFDLDIFTRSAGTTTGSTGASTAPTTGATGQPALGFEQPSRLGGPKAPQGRTVEPPLPTADSPKHERFLKTLHSSACKAFATILGPEANEAHRNHFHVDMADRSSGSFCE